MKTICYLVICILFFGCNSGTTNTKVAEKEASDSEVTSQWLSFEGKGDMPHIVLISGDEEYRSEEALPQLAKILSTRQGFKCTVLFAQDPAKPGFVNPNHLNNIPGLEKLKTADMMIIFTRFRALPDEQMQYIDDYLKSGKPVLGIRTATHAFSYEEADFESSWKHYGNFYEGDDEWRDGFGRFILGEKWISHHGEHRHQSTRGIPAPGAEDHPILSGIAKGEIWGPTDVYGVRLPLPGDSQPVVLGQVVNRAGEYDENDPLFGMRPTDSEVAGMGVADDENGEEIEINLNDPMMPIAWIKSYQLPGGRQGKVFATTIGASTDLLSDGVRRMLVNGVFWCLDLTVPEKANVDLVGTYKPTAYAFLEESYWLKRNLKVSDLE